MLVHPGRITTFSFCVHYHRTICTSVIAAATHAMRRTHPHIELMLVLHLLNFYAICDVFLTPPYRVKSNNCPLVQCDAFSTASYRAELNVLRRIWRTPCNYISIVRNFSYTGTKLSRNVYIITSSATLSET